jgi:hypothetical protein
MGVDTALEAHAQLAEGGQLGVGAFDDPAMAAQSVVALDALACDPVLDAAQPEMRMAAREVITLVGVQLVGGGAGARRAARQSPARRQPMARRPPSHVGWPR